MKAQVRAATALSDTDARRRWRPDGKTCVARFASTQLVVQAIVCSVVALVLISIGWNRMPVFARVIAMDIVLAAGWTLLDAGGRRLPAILGW